MRAHGPRPVSRVLLARFIIVWSIAEKRGRAAQRASTGSLGARSLGLIYFLMRLVPCIEIPSDVRDRLGLIDLHGVNRDWI